MKNIIRRLDKLAGKLETLGLTKLSSKLEKLTLKLAAKPISVNQIYHALGKVTKTTQHELNQLHEELAHAHEADVESQQKLETLTGRASKFLSTVQGEFGSVPKGWESVGSTKDASGADESLMKKAQKGFDLLNFLKDRYSEALYDLERHVPKDEKEHGVLNKLVGALKKGIAELRTFMKKYEHVTGKKLTPSHSFELGGIKNLDDLLPSADE